MDKESVIRIPIRLCKCGCGEIVNSKSAKYIKGHYFKDKEFIERKRVMTKLLWANNDFKNKVGEKIKTTLNMPDINKKLRTSIIKSWTNERREAYSHFMIKKHSNIEYRNNATKRIRNTWKDLDYKKRRLGINFSRKPSRLCACGCGQLIKSKNAKYTVAHSPEFIKGRSGENSHNWMGGSSKKRYCKIFRHKWFRKIIFNRDHSKCQNCFTNNGRICLHHIDYDKNNCRLDNIILLCNKCNILANFNRSYWELKFKKILLSRNILKRQPIK